MTAWYTRWMCCYSEILIVWRNGTTGVPWSSTKENGKSFNWAGIIPGIILGCRLERRFVEKDSGSRSASSWTSTSNMPLWQRRPVASRAALRRALPAGWRRLSFICTQHCVRNICSTWVWTTSCNRDMNTLGVSSLLFSWNTEVS